MCAGEGLAEGEVVEALDGLVDKSLVIFGEEKAGQGRYRLLETIRAYAAEWLHTAGERELLAGRHAAFFARLAQDCAKEGDTLEALDRLEADHPNLLAALDEFAAGDDQMCHGELAAALASFWDLHGHWQLASRELTRYLGRADRDRALEGRCAGGLGMVDFRLGRYPEARTRLEEALSIARELRDRR